MADNWLDADRVQFLRKFSSGLSVGENRVWRRLTGISCGARPLLSERSRISIFLFNQYDPAAEP